MKKILVFLAAVLILASAGYGGYNFYLENKTTGGSAVDVDNFLNEVTTFSTTTYSGSLPVKVLARNYNRQYAHIENDSATAVYIYLQNFDGTSTSSQEVAASTTVGINKGIRLAANGGSYDIKPENLYVGDVFASSTAGGLKILTTYR